MSVRLVDYVVVAVDIVGETWSNLMAIYCVNLRFCGSGVGPPSKCPMSSFSRYHIQSGLCMVITRTAYPGHDYSSGRLLIRIKLSQIIIILISDIVMWPPALPCL